MISLTFVRNSNGSNGTVGRTTVFWSARYGFESSIYLKLFLLKRFSFEDCFLTPIKITFFRRFSFWALWIRKLTFVGTLFFSFIIILFKITKHKSFSTFLPNWFRRHNILKHSSAVYATHKQVLAKTKRSLPRKISVGETKKGQKIVVQKTFRYNKLTETQKSSPTIIFGTVRQKIFN